MLNNNNMKLEVLSEEEEKYSASIEGGLRQSGEFISALSSVRNMNYNNSNSKYNYSYDKNY